MKVSLINSTVMGFLRREANLIAALKETRLSAAFKDPDFPFSLVRRGRQGEAGGRGVAYLVHSSLSYTFFDISAQFPNDDIAECKSISITAGQQPLSSIFKFHNVSLPTSIPHRFLSDFHKELRNLLIMSNFNAYHDVSHSRTGDAAVASKSVAICESLVSTHVRLCNTNIQTNNKGPNKSLSSAHLALETEWTTHAHLKSDHLRIAISIESASSILPRRPRTFTNYKKGDWEFFRRETE